MANERMDGVSPLLRVDEVRVDLASVAVHAQREPYPGGHRWFLSLIGPGAEHNLSGALGAAGRPLDAEASERLLSDLQSYLLSASGGAAGTARFFLNPVDHLDVETGHLMLGGDCSPVI